MSIAGGVRAVAVLEAAKGALVLLAGFGLFALVHHDVQEFAERIVGHFHLNPSSGVPRVFLDAAGAVTDARLWLLAWAAMSYAGMRFIEAYGLWRGRRWAEWFAVVSGSIYVPIEIYELWQGITWIRVSTLAVNAAIVAYMSYALRHRERGELPEDPLSTRVSADKPGKERR